MDLATLPPHLAAEEAWMSINGSQADARYARVAEASALAGRISIVYTTVDTTLAQD